MFAKRPIAGLLAALTMSAGCMAVSDAVLSPGVELSARSHSPSPAPSPSSGSPDPVDIQALQLCSLLSEKDIEGVLDLETSSGQYMNAMLPWCEYPVSSGGLVWTEVQENERSAAEWASALDALVADGAEPLEDRGLVGFVRVFPNYGHSDRPATRVIAVEVAMTDVVLTVQLDDIAADDDALKAAAIELMDLMIANLADMELPRLTPEPTPSPIATAAPATGRCDERLPGIVAHIADGLASRRAMFEGLMEADDDTALWGLMALGAALVAERDWFIANVPDEGAPWPAIHAYGESLHAAAAAWELILGAGPEPTEEQSNVAFSAFADTEDSEAEVRRAGDGCP